MTESDETRTRLGDRYEVGGLLGRGGMADVRVGRDLRLGRTVAIKQLRADLAADETFQERFRREAQSAASLNHPSIVAVYDTGEATDAHGNDFPYIVMELVEGRTLRDILREGRKILPERALSIVADILSALDYSHRAGIIHRDIKPANVMLTPTGQVKVMDFGIARAIADTSTAMTQTAAVIGTAQYLSPEQARGETVDARSDIYSTGCVLYELLTSRPPFVGDSPVSVAYQHVREEAKPPSQLNADVSQDVDNIVARALAKRVDDRYSSAAEMRKDIERVIAGGVVEAPLQSTQAMTAVAPVPPVSTVPAAPEEPPTDEKSSKKGWWWALAVLALALAVAGGFVLYTMGSGEPPPEETEVPVVVGQQEDVAVRALENRELVVGNVTRQADSDVPSGEVISSNPEAGTVVTVGDSVDLVVSSGPDTVVMPSLSGYDLERATELLEGSQYGLQVDADYVTSDEPRNSVLNSNPPAGSDVERGSSVTLIVSEGQVQVPDVVGMSQDDAVAALEDANLTASVTESIDGTVEPGTVIAQSTTAGTSVSPRTSITITVALEDPEPEPTPEPTATDPVPTPEPTVDQ